MTNTLVNLFAWTTRDVEEIKAALVETDKRHVSYLWYCKLEKAALHDWKVQNASLAQTVHPGAGALA